MFRRSGVIYAALLCTSLIVPSAAASSAIAKVTLSRGFFSPSLDQSVTLAITLNKPGKLHVVVLDRDGIPVRNPAKSASVAVVSTPMPTIESVFQAIDEAAARSDPDGFREAAYELETLMMYGDAELAQEVARRVTGLLSSNEFRASFGAWHVLFALRHDLEKIPEEERRRFFLAMVEAFDSFADWMSCFTVSELAEYFPTSWALNAVRTRLANSEERVRQYVPHALEHIARAAVDHTVAQQAFDSLVSMLGDAAPAVRDEVRASLIRIGNTDGGLARIIERQDKPGRSRGDQVRDPPPKA